VKEEKMSRRTISLVAILSAILLFGAIPACAAAQITHYVNPDGTCGGDTPCYTTIQQAVDNATAGDTIMVAAGTYTEQVEIPEGLNNLKLLGHSKDDTTIQWGTKHVIRVKSPVTIQGFHITTTDETVGIKIDANGTAANPGIIQDDKIDDLDRAITFVGSKEYWEIRDTEITNCRSGIYFERATHIIVSGNTFSEGLAACGGIAGDDVQIIWNTFAGSTEEDSEAIGFCADLPTNLSISHNTITGYDYGIRLHDCTEGGVDPSVQVHCNDIAGNSEYGILNENDGADLDATGNWWGDKTGPSHSPGLGDKVSANVDYDSWLPTPFEYCPECGGAQQAPAFSAIGLLALIGILSVVLAVAIVRRRE
jgi:hypothetical protein